jgi:transcriptional regulator with XRE-family HTH domain
VSEGRLQRRFGRTVRRRREAQGLSQEALAEAAGLHRTYVSLLERGRRNPSLEVICAVAKGLGTSMASLVGELD